MTLKKFTLPSLLCAASLSCAGFGQALAGVTSEEAAQLKSTLTPFGAEKAGNKEGTIPAWSGGYTTAVQGFKNGGRRGDPFANEKPLFSISAKNADQYADKLTDGTKALLKKYPNSYRLDVFQTHRTAAAPQWVYDNTFKNATTAKMNGEVVTGAYGGIPFPIPKSGREIMANHLLHWRGEGWQQEFRQYLMTSDGKRVLASEGNGMYQMPYYFKDAADKFKGDYWMIRLTTSAPAIRAGEAISGLENIDPDKSQAWVYLTGQRRVRKLPNACCDTPTPASAGVMSFDEIDVWNGRGDRFDWKIVGKKEMYIPYNVNGLYTPKSDADVLGANHLNPDHVRWELHRVWVVEATVQQGKRHQAPKSRYYIDEDTWVAVLADRWDANGQLWKTVWSHPVVMPDLPATTPQQQFGFNDLLSGAWYMSGVVNEKNTQYRIMNRMPESSFTGDALAGEGVR
ncbi:DUF1329 domain-containing protein [Noviherbaspirillum saxi]|uniref:DUF1329 domain-containing protein n=1 Tax=Noviherbaspirillum saxi TaxID=2320863 RepID=A0A3A3FJJ8_9BURK|nr:DUF1329 domain-containing protein [Noviherbaspirillum saxi]RJF95673.1 DUF1329 domain-containing protein [Noviherbaspirillum saxi]